MGWYRMDVAKTWVHFQGFGCPGAWRLAAHMVCGRQQRIDVESIACCERIVEQSGEHATGGFDVAHLQVQSGEQHVGSRMIGFASQNVDDQILSTSFETLGQ